MCRWIAYRGETVPLERYVTEPAHSLVVQSLRAKESVGATNGDGFGLGWYGDRDEPGLYREVRPAWSDENLKHLCRHIRSPLFFAHVRAATGTPTTRPNCHPFVHGKLDVHAQRAGRRLVADPPPRRRADPRRVLQVARRHDRFRGGVPGDPGRRRRRRPDRRHHAHADDPHRARQHQRHHRAAAVHRGAGRRPRISTPSATPMAARRTRCTTARPATASSWCRSRSTWSASSGSRCRPAI